MYVSNKHDTLFTLFFKHLLISMFELLSVLSISLALSLYIYIYIERDIYTHTYICMHMCLRERRAPAQPPRRRPCPRGTGHRGSAPAR